MSCSTGSGRLRERVTLQQEARVTDTGGGYELSWQDVRTVRARVKPKHGTEQVQGQQLQASTWFYVTIRYREGVEAGQRLLWKGAPLNIRSVINPDEKRQWLELLCEKGVAT